MSKTLPFTYYGSKYSSFDFINSKLPRTRQYIEPFGGAGTILLNRQPVPIETYNDLNDDIPHFFRVLRERPDELLNQLRKTPYSRTEYEHALTQRAANYPDCSNVERARLFLVLMDQAYSTRQQSGGCTWSYTVAGRAGRGTDVTTDRFKNRTEDALPEIAGRLRDVQIENRPAIDVIEAHDRETATFYVDPPYIHSTRGNDNNYELEMVDDDHRELAILLRDCDGYVAVSGYPNSLYEDLFDDWNRYATEEKKSQEGSGTRQEVLWTNYDADELGGQKIGDWPEPTRKGKQLTLTGSAA